MTVLLALEIWFADAIYAVRFVKDPVIHDDDPIFANLEAPDVSGSEQGPVDTSGYILSHTVEALNSPLEPNSPIQFPSGNQGMGSANSFTPSTIMSSPRSWQPILKSSTLTSILEGEEEARLFRHFIENLGPWVKLLHQRLKRQND